MQARDIMSSPVVSVTPDMTVKYAAKLLSAHGFTALPVLDVADLVRVLLDDRIRSVPIVDGARDDAVISADVRHQLSIYGGPQRWTIEVHNGAVEVVDAFDDETDRHVATVLAQAVPGVTAVHVAGTSTVG
jgi:CBS domain-containing protein